MSDFEPKFPTAIDSTILNAYRSCRRQYWYAYARGLSPARPSEHLHFGGCFASGLEKARLGFYREGLTAADAVAEGARTIIEEWGDFEPPEKSVKTLANCLVLLDSYFEEWPLGNDTLLPWRNAPDAPPAVEFSFGIPLPHEHPNTGDPLLYVGRSDMPCVLRDAYGTEPWNAREVWMLDDKTTGSLGGSWSKRWRLRGQFIGYTWAARVHGIPAKGAMVRGCAVYKTKKPEFQECAVAVPDYQIQKWYEALVNDVAEMLQCYRMEHVIGHASWGMNFGEACAAYGGCTFIDLCMVADPEPFIPNQFIERRWNPLVPIMEKATG